MSKRMMDLQLFNTTDNVIIPEVVAQMISAELPARIIFAPMATVDRTLQGQPGDTITLSAWEYSGDAQDLPEGQPVPLDLLSSTQRSMTIKKIAKGMEITDEAKNRGMGDPKGEIIKQTSLAMGNKVDKDVLQRYLEATLTTDVAALDLDAIDKGIDKMVTENQFANLILVVGPEHVAPLRKAVAGNWERPSDLGDSIITTGVLGGVLGAQVIKSEKLRGTNKAILAQSGAVNIYLKQEVGVEYGRDIRSFKDIITASQHYGTHLYDDSKVSLLNITGTTTP